MPIPSSIRLGTSFKTSIDDYSDISFSIDLIKLMVANGVIKAVPYRWGEKKYTFAYLYKYKLGLKNRRKEYYND